MKNFYITTPIYYPSGKLHLGHAYTTIAGDVIKKHHQLLGDDVYYLTGSDEHGEKIEEKASQNGMEPIEYVDGIVDGFKEMWELLDIDYDQFIRTTDEKHIRQVKYIFNKLLENDDIYLGEYVGLYCTSCESYYTDTQAEDNCCPDCGKELKELKEECYFFRCSKYVDRLVEHFNANPNFLLPISRKNEILNNFILPGLQDLAVSRTNFKWGIEVDANPKHVIYVWIDALSNYITALGYADNDELFNKYWPANIQLMGKEITRFHVIYWPMILMALDLELPKQLFAHGWLLMDKDKMSKSKGNIVYPEFLVENYGVDSIRYYLMREVSFGADGLFTPDSYINRINNDLVNDLGNLVNRTIAMVNKYFEGTIKLTNSNNEHILQLEEEFDVMHSTCMSGFEKMEFSKNLQSIWKFIGHTNKLIDLCEPWVLFKEEKLEELNDVLYTLIKSIHRIAVYCFPYINTSSKNILSLIGVNDLTISYEIEEQKSYTVSDNPTILFERLDTDAEILKIQQKMDVQKAEAKAKLVLEETITFDEFKKVKQVVGEVVEAKQHDNAKRLLVFKVDCGIFGVRQVVSGISDFYDPESLLNKKVIVVINLDEVNLRGEVSQGMILCVGDAPITVVMVDLSLENGSVLE